MLADRRAWYDLMIADEVRNSAYKRALTMYATGRTVVDVGAGLGHLTSWALEAGAREVTAIEADTDAFDAAHECVRWPSSVTWIRLPSWEVGVGRSRAEDPMCEISPPADIVVAEIFDSSGVGEGAIETLKDARRFLRPGGIMIPDWMRLHLCLLYEPIPAPPGKLVTLAPTGEWYSDSPWFDWSPGEEVGVHVQRSGDVYDFGLAFTLGLAPGVTLTNLPGHPATHWGQGALPFSSPLKVERGQVLIVRGEVDHSRDRLNPDVSFNVTRIEGP